MLTFIGNIISIGVLILIVYGLLRFHWYCKDKYSFSPFNMFSILSLVFMNFILAITTTIAADYKAAYLMKALNIVLPTATDISLDDGMLKIVMLLLGVLIIIGFILAENIKKMGVLVGITGTIVAVLLCTSGIVMLWLPALVIMARISGKD